MINRMMTRRDSQEVLKLRNKMSASLREKAYSKHMPHKSLREASFHFSELV